MVNEYHEENNMSIERSQEGFGVLSFGLLKCLIFSNTCSAFSEPGHKRYAARERVDGVMCIDAPQIQAELVPQTGLVLAGYHCMCDDAKQTIFLYTFFYQNKKATIAFDSISTDFQATK